MIKIDSFSKINFPLKILRKPVKLLIKKQFPPLGACAGYAYFLIPAADNIIDCFS